MARSKQLEAFGRRVARLRRARGFSQEELAARAKLGPQYLSKLERGAANPSLLVLLALARGLGSGVESLLTDGAGAGTDAAALFEGRSKAEQAKALAVLRALFGE